jgi:hypothetical protein
VTDYDHDLLFGAFLNPDARQPATVLELGSTAEDLGLDLLTFQDHPYQPGLLDTWTLLSFLAARTTRIRLMPNVANVPLRPPAVLARSAAALDILSGGRVELGLGAGYFLDAIASMGGPRRSAAENVDALAEAITVIRDLWSDGQPVSYDGWYYRLQSARPGPVPPHPIRIWIGAYKRRMLQLTGRVGDGWVPTLGYAEPAELAAMTRTIDAAAEDAGRAASDIRRIFNISGTFGAGAGFLQGPPAVWAEQLTELVLEEGMSTFILGPGADAEGDLRRFAEEVAPAVQEAVDRERQSYGRRVPTEAGVPSARLANSTARHAAHETRRLVEEQEPISAIGRAGQQTLLAVHEHLRQELRRLRDTIHEVASGQASAAAARSFINQMTMRQNYWTLGAFCAAYCRVVSVHHAIEDQNMFRDLNRADPSLGPVLDRLQDQHEVIARLLTEVDAALVAMIEDEGRLSAARTAVDRLSETLLDHLSYEEEQLLGPIGRLSIGV